jgi:uncharacterized protein (DUF362 family)
MQSGSSVKPKEWITAAASRDTAPRIGLIPSSYTGGEEIDGRKIRSLIKPAPLAEPLTAAQLEDMLHLAVELGGGRRGGLATAISRDDWVVIKVNVQSCPGDARFHAGAVTDPRIVASVLRYLASRGLGRRFTIAEGAPCRGDVWDTTWDNHFDGLSYRAMVRSLTSAYPNLRWELADLNSSPSIVATVEGRAMARRNPQGAYHVPRLLRECDKIVSIAPLATMPGSGIGLSIMNYLGFASGAQYGYPKNLAALGEPGEVALDLFSFHPADYAIAGGTFAADTRMRRHNVLIAGTSALAVDTVGAAVMGVDPESIPHLGLAVKCGYGTNEAYSIWTRGAEIDDVKAEFAKP